MRLGDGVPSENEILVESIHVTCEEHQQVEIDRIVNVQARADAGLGVGKIRIFSRGHELIQIVERASIFLIFRAWFALFVARVPRIAKICLVIYGLIDH